MILDEYYWLQHMLFIESLAGTWMNISVSDVSPLSKNENYSEEELYLCFVWKLGNSQ
jgi:hypothetical protein